jgi:hypothetical protein
MIRSVEKLSTYARMKMAQMMHGKRTTQDFLFKFGLIDEDMCDMCKQGKETNTHVMNECTHTACTDPRGKIAQMMQNLISEQGGNHELQEVIHELYNVNAEGSGNHRNIEYDDSNESARVSNSPEKWKSAFTVGAPASKYVAELGHARAYELLLRVGSDTPLWSGIITVQHEYLLRWGALPATKTTTTFTQMRAILNAYARVTWRNRCEVVYSPENQKRRVERKLRKEASMSIADMGLGSRITVEQLLRMTPKQKVKLRQLTIGEWKEQTRQPTLQQMSGFTIITKAQRANKHYPPTTTIPSITRQQTITKQGAIGPVTDCFHNETPQNKTHTKKKDNNQPTLMEIWKIARTDKDINKTSQRRRLHGNKIHTPRSKGPVENEITNA